MAYDGSGMDFDEAVGALAVLRGQDGFKDDYALLQEAADNAIGEDLKKAARPLDEDAIEAIRDEVRRGLTKTAAEYESLRQKIIADPGSASGMSGFALGVIAHHSSPSTDKDVEEETAIRVQRIQDKAQDAVREARTKFEHEYGRGKHDLHADEQPENAAYGA